MLTFTEKLDRCCCDNTTGMSCNIALDVNECNDNTTGMSCNIAIDVNKCNDNTTGMSCNIAVDVNKYNDNTTACLVKHYCYRCNPVQPQHHGHVL